jgi:predicted permease
MPPGFTFPDGTQLWLPYQNWIETQHRDTTRAAQRSMRWLEGIARLRPGVSIEQAQEELGLHAAALAEEHPETNQAWRPRLTAYREHETRALRPYLRTLFVTSWLFVLLAALNVASLQIARGLSRSARFALQLALGVRASRLGRQLLVETLLLTGLGGALALPIARLLVNRLPSFAPTSLPSWLDLRVGPAELGFTLVVVAGVALLAGLAPLLLALRLDLRSLVDGRSRSSPGGRRVRATLVAAEIALAALLLVAAGLLAQSFRALQETDPGFAADEVLMAELSPQHLGTYDEQMARLAQLYRRVQERLEEIPGVVAVGGTTHLPYLDRQRRPVAIRARGGESEEEREHSAPILTVDLMPRTFDALGISILEGRDFLWSDERESGQVIVLSRRAAELLFPGRSAIGQEARIASDSWARVVGVVEDVRYDPRESGFGAELYYPITQYRPFRLRLAVRVDGPLAAFDAPVRTALRAVAPEAGVIDLRPYPAILDESMWQSRLLGTLAPLFAGIALLLASLGVYGLLSHDLAERRQELAVRTAVGASGAGIARLVLWSALRLALLGVGAGIAGAYLLGPALAASLYGVAARDPLAYGIAGGSLLVVGVLAGLVPAWRAARFDITRTLRRA